mmetsp:Transcript_11502/g.23404  ORF Transcript_11502/g.23404 Transcript_11502/m.23404 type:complete len:86 (-) Transcript_11502:61-318(-)
MRLRASAEDGLGGAARGFELVAGTAAAAAREGIAAFLKPLHGALHALMEREEAGEELPACAEHMWAYASPPSLQAMRDASQSTVM